MYLLRRLLHLLLILSIALSAVAPAAGVVSDSADGDGEVHHHGLAAEDTPTDSEADHSPSGQGCAGMEAASDCCSSCVGCAIPIAFSIHVEPMADAFSETTQYPPYPDLDAEVRPPRLLAS